MSLADKLIQDWIEEERARCLALASALAHEKEFLIYCIENAVCAREIEAHRQRFSEFPSKVDDFEDLM